jgi:hypothetical protein
VHSAHSACCGPATTLNRPGQHRPLPAWPQQGVHRKLPQPTAHFPDTVESPSSLRGRRVTEGHNSLARSTVPELNGGEEVTWAGLGAPLGPCGAPGPAGKEGDAVRRNLHGGCCGSGTGGDGGSPGDQWMAEGGQYARGRGPYILVRSEAGWGSMGGGTRVWGMG